MLCQQATLVDRNGGTADVEDQEKSSTRTRKCYPIKAPDIVYVKIRY